jgi:hypothetical protein
LRHGNNLDRILGHNKPDTDSIWNRSNAIKMRIRELTKSEKLTVLQAILEAFNNGRRDCLCNAIVQQARFKKYVSIDPNIMLNRNADVLIPELLKFKPYGKSIFEPWFGITNSEEGHETRKKVVKELIDMISEHKDESNKKMPINDRHHDIDNYDWTNELKNG